MRYLSDLQLCNSRRSFDYSFYLLFGFVQESVLLVIPLGKVAFTVTYPSDLDKTQNPFGLRLMLELVWIYAGLKFKQTVSFENERYCR